MSALDVLDAGAAGRDSDGVALVSVGGALSWSELEARVSARAEQLRGSVRSPGSLHPLVVDADTDGVVELLAAWRAGLVPAPLNARLTEAERARAREALTDAPPGCQAVLWTSGTSGRPRGVALGAAGLVAHVGAVAERLELDGSEVWLASLSPAHVGGLALIARAAMTGATMVLPGRGATEDLARTLRRASPAVTHLSLVPTQLDRLMSAWGDAPPPPGLRCILIGGAHAPPDLVRGATAAGWPVALTYGMTEMWSQVATSPPSVTRANPDAVGAALTGVELRIDAADEILVRGPTRALGYAGTGASSGLESLVDDEGWYHTGDLGRVDESGLLHITGRRSDRIISGGVNVDPAEVEDVIRQHPAVLDVVVVGVPSREWGEAVAAVVVPVWEHFELSEVERFVRGKISGPKRPKVWKIEGQLPLNANGKVDRASARALFAVP
jgi:o-succinylbenzoate---CoA ligase